MKEYKFNQDGLKHIESFDCSITPAAFKEVLILKGSWFDMGLQYGKTTSELIKRNVGAIYSEILDFNEREVVPEKLAQFMGYVYDKTPEIFQFWQGIAEGAGIPVEQIGLINYEIPLVCESSMCSGIGARGSATADGGVVIGGNVDSMVFANIYGVTLVVYPETGHPFVTAPGAAGHIASGMAMNSLGITGTLAGGQHARDIDKKTPAYDPIGAMAVMMNRSSDLEELEKTMEELVLWGGGSFIFGDMEKIYAKERTNAIERIRRPGDHGEDDYLIISNHYLEKDMEPCHFPLEMQEMNSYVRYATEEHLVKRSLGTISAETIMDILGSRSCMLDDELIEEYWPDEDNPDGRYNTPNMQDALCQTCITECAVPAKRIMLIRSGLVNRCICSIPEGYGTYYSLKLGKDESETLQYFETEAAGSLWLAGKAICDEKRDDLAKVLSRGKKLLHEGFNWKNKSKAIEAQEEKMICISRAATCFAEAQLIGRQIRQDLF